MVFEFQIFPDDLKKSPNIITKCSFTINSIIFMFYELSENLPDKTCSSTNRWQIRRNIKAIVSKPTRHN